MSTFLLKERRVLTRKRTKMSNQLTHRYFVVDCVCCLNSYNQKLTVLVPRIPVSTKYRLQTFRWRTAWIKMFGAIHQHLRQYLIQNFSPHSRREGTITMIVLRCTGLHFLSNNYPPFRSMSNTFTIGKLISFICPVVSHFSWRAVKYMLKTQKSQHFSF